MDVCPGAGVKVTTVAADVDGIIVECLYKWELIDIVYEQRWRCSLIDVTGEDGQKMSRPESVCPDVSPCTHRPSGNWSRLRKLLVRQASHCASAVLHLQASGGRRPPAATVQAACGLQLPCAESDPG